MTKTVTVYHGTSEDALRNILRRGIVPKKRKNHRESGDYVYVELSASTARAWGGQAHATRVSVLEIEAPADVLVRDTKTTSDSSFRTGAIPAAWIKGWDIYHLNARTGLLDFVRSETVAPRAGPSRAAHTLARSAGLI